MLTAAGSALVAGSTREGDMTTATRHVRVTRAFLMKGKRQDVGAELELPTVFAIEVVHGNKAEFIAAPAPSVEPEKASADKGRKNVR
jgi:hypothetical protein